MFPSLTSLPAYPNSKSLWFPFHTMPFETHSFSNQILFLFFHCQNLYWSDGHISYGFLCVRQLVYFSNLLCCRLIVIATCRNFHDEGILVELTSSTPNVNKLNHSFILGLENLRQELVLFCSDGLSQTLLVWGF